jgi:hypothetical protein
MVEYRQVNLACSRFVDGPKGTDRYSLTTMCRVCNSHQTLHKMQNGRL